MPKPNNIDDQLEVVSLKAPLLPKRSRLYFIEPIGVGTPYTESLTSYLNRLAYEHCLTPKQLIMREVAPQIMGQDFEASLLKKKVSTLFANSDAKPALNGMKVMTQNLTQALEVLTQRKDIKFLSFLSWKEVINGRGLFRQYRAWCPQCYEQWQSENKSVYDPLIWSLRDVNYCIHHRCHLVDKCPYCSSNLPVIANFLQLGYCSQCKLWLGSQEEQNKNVVEELSPERIQWNDYKTTSLGEIIAITPQLSSLPTLQGINQKLQMILFCGERIVARDLTQFISLGKLMEQLKITVNQYYDRPFNLVKLIVPVCYQTQLSVTQFFMEELNVMGQTLLDNFRINYKIS